MPLPDLDIFLIDVASKSVLDQEILDRAAADTSLQNSISSEATSRASADSSLQNQINTNAGNLASEITNRINADVVLQNNINAAIAGLLDGVASPGNTLQKLYNLILGSFKEESVPDIAARDAYNAVNSMHIFVVDDGDGKWALYKATSSGVNATYVKLSDPDLLNAVMSASQIKTAYESNPDTNAFTNALKAKLDAITGTNTGNETATSIGNINHGATNKTTLVDADEVTGQDSANSFGLIRTTWGQIKTFLAATFLSRSNNLSDLGSASTARTNLGLGNSATLDIGTSAGTVRAGDDLRFKDVSSYKKTGTTTLERWYSNAIVGYTPTPNVYTHNVLRGMPIIISVTQTWDRIGLEVTTIGAAGSVIRLGLYDSVNNIPTNRIADYGTVPGDSLGVKTIEISQTLTPGLYFFALNHNSTTNVYLRAIHTNACPNVLGLAATFGADLAANSIVANLPYTTMPSTFTTAGMVAIGGWAPEIRVRLSSI